MTYDPQRSTNAKEDVEWYCKNNHLGRQEDRLVHCVVVQRRPESGPTVTEGLLKDENEGNAEQGGDVEQHEAS